MKCSTCSYRKHIPLYSKCAGVTGRTRVGTAYYCGHPEMRNPVPIVPMDGSILEDCPVARANVDIDMAASKTAHDTKISG